jgi:hypothetical protein
LHAPGLAQEEQERVPLIMSKLPPQGSALYNAIKRHAGKAKGQDPQADQDRDVGRAQAQRGARTSGRRRSMAWASDQLGNDFNHVFQSAPPTLPMDDKQKSMMDRAKASRASMGVGMMLAPRAPTVEYALTKDADSEPAAATMRRRSSSGLSDAKS